MAYISFKPTDHFNTKLYTGNGSTNAITGVGFQPDFTWIKKRDATEGHKLFDSARGVTKLVQSSSSNAEQTNATSLTAFGADGFTLGSAGITNNNTNTFVSWNWKGGTTSGITTNGSTTITPSTYSFNATSGVSILNYTGNMTAGAKLAHGMGKTPKFWACKNISNTESWTCYHQAIGNGKFMTLNGTNAATTASNRWNDTDPDSVNITLGAETSVSGTGTDNMLCYAFCDVKGFASFGKFQGNASATNSPYIYTGFEPAMVIIKRSDGANSWGMKTAKTQVYNVADVTLFANATGAESAFSGNQVDLLSNGFKIRTTSSDFNTNGGNYIYMAWAENPIVGSDGTPGLAR